MGRLRAQLQLQVRRRMPQQRLDIWRLTETGDVENPRNNQVEPAAAVDGSGLFSSGEAHTP